jgi:iron complex outermembrane receptor protein
MMDAGSVEVLRGPQGTLYGRNATGGAINVTPAGPTNHFTGSANVSYSNFNTVRGEAAVSGPLIPNLLLGRIAVLGENNQDGYARDVISGAKLGTDREAGVHGALRFLPTQNLTIDLDGYYFHATNTSDFWTNLQPVSPAQLAANPDFANHPASFDSRRPAFDFDPQDRQTDKGVVLGVNWVASPELTVRSTTSYTDLAYDRLHVDCDGTATPTCNSNRLDTSHSWQEELDLKMSLFDHRLSWLVGGFFDDDKVTALQFFPWFNATQGLVNVDGFPLPNGTQTEQIDQQHTTSLAGFTDATFKINHWLDIYGGARVSWDKRTINLTSGLGLTPGGQILLGCTDMANEVSYSNVSGKAGLQAHLSPNSQVYAQWQDGFKAGGFNPAQCGGTFKPETINAFEIGYKTRQLNGHLTLSAAAFHYDYSNLQIAQIEGVSYSITNAASAKIDGLEIEATALPFAKVQIDGQVSLLDARYRTYSNFDPIDLAAGMQNLSGHALNRAPKFSGTVGLQDTWTVFGGGSVTLRGEAVFTTDIYYRPFGGPLDKQSGYTTGNAFLTYRPAGSNLQLRTYVRNIANKTILAGIFTEDVTQTREGQFQPPRTYGVGISYKF